MDQLEFFGDFNFTPEGKETKRCTNCNKEQAVENFPFFSTKGAGRKNTCKSCNLKLYKVRKRLKAENPLPPYGPCPICGKHTKKWVLDHCHFTESFRGYICDRCNLGMGNFNDDVELLKKAIEYLEQKKSYDN